MKRIACLPPQSNWKKLFDPVDALARAILFQQLNGKAASTAVGRVETAIGSKRLHSDTLGRIDVRACGVSGNKTLALRDLSLRKTMGEIPGVRQMSIMYQDDIVAALVPVRGIGRWTVEMMLMSRLGRPDVLPIDDLGIRKGAQRVDKGCSRRKSCKRVASARGRIAPTPACTYGALRILSQRLRRQPAIRRIDARLQLHRIASARFTSPFQSHPLQCVVAAQIMVVDRCQCMQTYQEIAGSSDAFVQLFELRGIRLIGCHQHGQWYSKHEQGFVRRIQ